MFRCASLVFRSIHPLSASVNNAARVINNFQRFSTLLPNCSLAVCKPKSLLNNQQILDISKNLAVPVRTVTKFSLKKGKRKTVKAATLRFFRLDWGGWIRPKVGRHKHLWKKSESKKRRSRQHVLCNSTQCTLLDKMVTKFWKRPKYYVDDPYEPYHTREEYFMTRKKPRVF